MLTGSYEMSADAKARVTLPSTFRKVMGKAVVLIPLKSEGCVYGFTPEAYTAWVESLFQRDGGEYNPRAGRDVQLRRFLSGASVTVEIDSAGRVALGKIGDARQKLGLEKDVTFVGNFDHFEIWNSQKWAEQQETLEDDLAALMYQ